MGRGDSGASFAKEVKCTKDQLDRENKTATSSSWAGTFSTGSIRFPKGVELPKDQQDRDMIARELLIKFQMSPKHPLQQLNRAYRKF